MGGRASSRVLAWVLVVVMAGLTGVVAGSVRPAVAAGTVREAMSFRDITPGMGFSREVTWLGNAGVSTGYVVAGGREYRPSAPVLREQMAAFMYRLAGSPVFVAPRVSPFTDVATGHVFYREIAWLAARGISTGYELAGGRRAFKPGEPVLREQMSAFMYRLASRPVFAAPATSPFVDVTTTRTFYKEIAWLAESGITTGYDVGRGRWEFRPSQVVLREQMAAFMYRYSSPVEPVDPGDPDGAVVQVAPDVQVLAPVDAAATGTEFDPGARTLTLSPEAPLADEVSPNDVIAAGVSEATPEGLLARVVTVRTAPDGTVSLDLAPATLPDAITTTNGPLTLTGEQVSNEFAPGVGTTVDPVPAAEPAVLVAEQPATTHDAVFHPSDRTVPGPHVVPAASAALKTSFTWKDTIQSATSDGAFTGTGSVTATAKVTVEARAEVVLDIGYLKLNEAQVTVTPSLEATTSLKVVGELRGEVYRDIGRSVRVYHVQAGPVPIVITDSATLRATVTVSGSFGVEYTAGLKASSTFGFRYAGGQFDLIVDTPAPRIDTPSLLATAEAAAELRLGPHDEVKLYGLAGISFGLGPFAKATLTRLPAWACTLDIGLKTDIGVVAGIEVLGFRLGNWERTKTFTIALYTHDYCQGAPPGGGTGLLDEVAAGWMHSLAVTGEGGVLAWGANDYGQLGGGSTIDRSWPIGVPGLSGIVAVAAGGFQSFALAGDGTLYAWGQNDSGELGDGTTSNRYVPVRVPGVSGIVAVATGGGHSLAVTGDGAVYAWGSNGFGQVGDGTTSDRSSPVRVPGLSGIDAVAAGWSHSMAISNDGAVYAWGDNESGQLGDGTTIDRNSPVRVAGLSGIVDVAAGSEHSVALARDGTLYAWGWNSQGQVGDGTVASRFVPVRISGLPPIATVAAAGNHSLAVTRDGTLLAWGSNDRGELGDGTRTSRRLPSPVPGLSGVISATAGGYHSMATSAAGSLYSWGWNAYGQVGDGATIDRHEPVEVSLLRG